LACGKHAFPPAISNFEHKFERDGKSGKHYTVSDAVNIINRPTIISSLPIVVDDKTKSVKIQNKLVDAHLKGMHFKICTSKFKLQTEDTHSRAKRNRSFAIDLANPVKGNSSVATSSKYTCGSLCSNNCRKHQNNRPDWSYSGGLLEWRQ
jgi:hypothetical protein